MHGTFTRIFSLQLLNFRIVQPLADFQPCGGDARQPEGEFSIQVHVHPIRVALLRGEVASAREAFTRARKEIEGVVSQQPDYAQALCALGMIDAVLGNKEDAIREGRRAVELLPVTKDSIDGAQLVQYLAVIYAWVGQKDLALEQLRIATSIPGDLSYGSLQLDPLWDPLRGDPGFEKIVASLAPKQ